MPCGRAATTASSGSTDNSRYSRPGAGSLPADLLPSTRWNVRQASQGLPAKCPEGHPGADHGGGWRPRECPHSVRRDRGDALSLRWRCPHGSVVRRPRPLGQVALRRVRRLDDRLRLAGVERSAARAGSTGADCGLEARDGARPRANGLMIGRSKPDRRWPRSSPTLFRRTDDAGGVDHRVAYRAFGGLPVTRFQASAIAAASSGKPCSAIMRCSAGRSRDRTPSLGATQRARRPASPTDVGSRVVSSILPGVAACTACRLVRVARVPAPRSAGWSASG